MKNRFTICILVMAGLIFCAHAQATNMTFETWAANNRAIELLNTQEDGTGNKVGSRIDTVGPIAYEETTGTYTHYLSFEEGNGWTPNIVLNWLSNHFDTYQPWIDGHGDRGSVVQLDGTSGSPPANPADLVFNPDAGWGVLINSFDLDEDADATNHDSMVDWWIFDASGTLASGTWDDKNNINDPDHLGGRTTVYTGLTADDVTIGNAVTLRFVQTSPIVTSGGYVALDNLNFDQVPEPATLMLLGLGGMAVLRRRC